MSFDEDRMDAEAPRQVRPRNAEPDDGDGLRNAASGLRAVYRAMSRLDSGKSGEELAELAEAARFLSTMVDRYQLAAIALQPKRESA